MGSTNGGVVNNRYLQLNTSIQQNIAGNYTDIYYDVWLGQTGSSIAGTINPLVIKFDDVTVVSQSVVVNGAGWIQLFGTGVRRVQHGANGSSPAIKIDVTATFGFLGISNLTVSAVESLPTIPRSTTPSGLLDNYDFGSTISINLPRAVSTYVHDVKYVIVNTEYTNNNVATSDAFVIPNIKMQSIPNSTSYYCYVEVTTKASTTGPVIGSPVRLYFNANVPSSVVPTVSINTPVISSGLSGYVGAIQGVSSISLSNTSAGIWASTIRSYYWEVGTTMYTTSAITGVKVNAASTMVKCTVTDSRGRTATATTTIAAIAYTPPTSDVVATRCDVAGNQANEGQYFKITPTYTFTNINNLNNPTLRHEILNTSYFNTGTTSGNSVVLGNNDLLKTNRYTVRSVVTDKIGNAAISTYVVEIAKVLLNWTNDGTGIAINKFYEGSSDALQVGGDTRVDGYIYTTKLFINGEEAGTEGIPGAQGPKGDIGLTGPQGPKGDKGDKGDTGNQGIQGIQGIKGDTGSQGIQGPVGNTGSTGAKGDKGDKGDTGNQGIQGIQGVKGDTGNTGIQGPTGTTGTTGSAGTNGTNGVGVSSSAITYQLSSSGITAPTGTWLTNPPVQTVGTPFLWTRTIITYSNSTTSTIYSIGTLGATGNTGATGSQGIQGIQGPIGNTGLTGSQGPIGNAGATGAAGKGISSTTITYQLSNGGTTAPTGTWLSTIPTQTTTNPYLWTRIIHTFTDSTTTNSYSIGVLGATGAQGVQGIQGNTGSTGSQGVQGIQGATGSAGKGVSTSAIAYQLSSSGTVTPTGSWLTTVPLQTSSNPYLWTRTTLTFTDSTTNVAYSVGALGATGSQGIQGIQGNTGNTGLQGIQGIQGPQGIKGDKGDVGAGGAQGPQGIQGPIGLTGASGIDSSGTNANGSYIRYSNGMMVQFGSRTISTPCNTAWSGHFYGTQSAGVYSYPVAFVGSNPIFNGTTIISSGNSWGSIAGNTTLTTMPGYYLFAPASVASISVRFEWTAWGFWK